MTDCVNLITSVAGVPRTRWASPSTVEGRWMVGEEGRGRCCLPGEDSHSVAGEACTGEHRVASKVLSLALQVNCTFVFFFY